MSIDSKVGVIRESEAGDLWDVSKILNSSLGG